MRWLLRMLVLTMALLPTFGSSAHAHPGARPQPRKILHQNLMHLFPEADPHGWRVKQHRYSEDELVTLRRELGFELPETARDHSFYLAHDGRGRFLGAVVFVSHRANARIGMAVDVTGRVRRLRVFGSIADPRLGHDQFLSQFEDRGLHSNFVMGRGGLNPVAGHVRASQRIADGVLRALLGMKLALGA